MTQASAPTPLALDSQDIALHYTVAMPQPESHLFEVSLTVRSGPLQTLDLKFPVWTPGSYLVREYVRHLQGFTAENERQEPLTWRKLSKNHWQIQTSDSASVTVRYRIFANELTVRTNHLDISHGYFNPAAMFFRVVGQEPRAIALTVVPPNPRWQVSTPLSALPERPSTYLAANFDELVDSPFEIGTQAIYDFEVLGKPHQLAVWGQTTGNKAALNVEQFDVEQVLADTQKIVETEANLFGGLPYKRYLFLLHLTANAYGGLEHKAASSLIYSRFGLNTKDGYTKFISLVAHEFFHLWNVKRIRPKGLEVFDYDRENYTDALWFCEGTTSFYDLVIPFRAGLYDAKCYLAKVSEAITKLQTTPGRLLQPLSESSFDAWIKLYRPDSNSRNAQISYYLKGEVVSFLLDLLIRQYSPDSQQSLDDVMRTMWKQFGKTELGYTREELKSAFESIATVDLTGFWANYIEGTEELPYDSLLNPFGLQLTIVELSPMPHLGFTTKLEQGAMILNFVEAGSPAEQAGLEPGDELLAIDGYRVRTEQLSDRLQSYQPGEPLDLTVFHQDRLYQRRVILGEPVPTRYELSPIADPTPQQKERFRQWLGVELVTL
jgi:predicted metalloprotease with PDZ domain